MVTRYIPVVILESFKDLSIYHIVIEVGLLLWVIWLFFRKSYSLKDVEKLSESEENKLIDEWTPEDLVGETKNVKNALQPHVISTKAGKFITVDGCNCLNMATHNYLGFIGNQEIENEAIEAVKKYGVGSCGPRGFYGTVDVHLDLEEKIAKFMGMEEAVLYSYAFSTIASAIPAYSKRNDTVFVDESVNFSIQKGLDASRSKVYYFKHNDLLDLERLLIEQEVRDAKNPKKAAVTRRFLIVEGIYIKTGDLCPLPGLIELRNKYKLRIFIDENVSFGSLGKSGRGITEHFNIPREEVDMIVCSMEWALGSIGGFCVGTSFIIEHQRLSGLGYCFSASLPPLLTAAAIKALELIDKDPSMFETLQSNCSLVQKKFSAFRHLVLQGDHESPVKHLYLREPPDNSEAELIVLEEIVKRCIQKGVAFVMSSYLDIEKNKPKQSIRVVVSTNLSPDDIDKAENVLSSVCAEMFER